MDNPSKLLSYTIKLRADVEAEWNEFTARRWNPLSIDPSDIEFGFIITSSWVRMATNLVERWITDGWHTRPY